MGKLPIWQWLEKPHVGIFFEWFSKWLKKNKIFLGLIQYEIQLFTHCPIYCIL